MPVGIPPDPPAPAFDKLLLAIFLFTLAFLEIASPLADSLFHSGIAAASLSQRLVLVAVPRVVCAGPR